MILLFGVYFRTLTFLSSIRKNILRTNKILGQCISDATYIRMINCEQVAHYLFAEECGDRIVSKLAGKLLFVNWKSHNE